MPKISVVLPAYNGAEYLAGAVDSIIKQTLQDFELIIVDDCSTDETAFIARQFAEKYVNIKYIRNLKNQKLPESLNVGFAQACGEYWTWTSCDNVYLPDAFACLVAALETDPGVGLVYSDMQIINSQGAETDYLPAGCGTDLILRNVVGGCFLYRAGLARKIGPYNKEMFLCEDYEYWVRLAMVTELKPINKKLYLYRSHEESLSFKYEREVIAKGIAVQKTYYKHFVKSREMAARFYAFLRARDIYNPLRQLYILPVLLYSPTIFVNEIVKIMHGRIRRYAKN